MKPIAICQNKKIFDHYTSWTPHWISYCETKGIPYEIIDCYKPDIISKLSKYSALLWNYSNYVISDLIEARNILQIADNLGLVTFPSPQMNWHFDDKIAELYALQSINARIPKGWVFYLKDECIDWLNNKAKYPIVAKLKAGSGSNNVKLLKNKKEAINYANRMFTTGFNSTPSIKYKAYSKLQSSKDIHMIISRVKKIPQFLNTRNNAKMMPIEKGYCLFQEYIPNDGYDLKVVVVNDKLTYFARRIRKNDFRASGGGDIFYDNDLISDDIIKQSFMAAEKLNMSCVGFDFVVDKRTQKAKIIEMCYGFDAELAQNSKYYVDKNYKWHNNSIFVPYEIIKMIINKIEK